MAPVKKQSTPQAAHRQGWRYAAFNSFKAASICAAILCSCSVCCGSAGGRLNSLSTSLAARWSVSWLPALESFPGLPVGQMVRANLLAVVPARMRSPQEAAADAHSLNHIQGQTLVVDGQAHAWSKDRSQVAKSVSRGAYHLVVSNQFHRFGALAGAGAAQVAENAYPGRRPRGGGSWTSPFCPAHGADSCQ
jgi:hypothetical protein